MNPTITNIELNVSVCVSQVLKEQGIAKPCNMLVPCMRMGHETNERHNRVRCLWCSRRWDWEWREASKFCFQNGTLHSLIINEYMYTVCREVANSAASFTWKMTIRNFLSRWISSLGIGHSAKLSHAIVQIDVCNIVVRMNWPEDPFKWRKRKTEIVVMSSVDTVMMKITSTKNNANVINVKNIR